MLTTGMNDNTDGDNERKPLCPVCFLDVGGSWHNCPKCCNLVHGLCLSEHDHKTCSTHLVLESVYECAAHAITDDEQIVLDAFSSIRVRVAFQPPPAVNVSTSTMTLEVVPKLDSIVVAIRNVLDPLSPFVEIVNVGTCSHTIKANDEICSIRYVNKDSAEVLKYIRSLRPNISEPVVAVHGGNDVVETKTNMDTVPILTISDFETMCSKFQQTVPFADKKHFSQNVDLFKLNFSHCLRAFETKQSQDFFKAIEGFDDVKFGIGCMIWERCVNAIDRLENSLPFAIISMRLLYCTIQ
jgi:hypothetical protein